MSNACAFRLGRIIAMVTAAAWVGCVQSALAQGPEWNVAPNGLLPMIGADPYTGPAAAIPISQRGYASRRGPLANLIENPDQTDGAPPFALTDQAGTIQRYVEPVPGIDLAAYVGQVVVVRHDTGPILLASQLELPPQPFYPLVRDAGRSGRAAEAGRIPRWNRLADSDRAIEQVQYIDNDDATVQLLPDDVSLPAGDPAAAGNAMPMEMIGPGGEYPVYPDQMMMSGMGGAGCGPQCYGPMPYGAGGTQPYPGPTMGMGPCPQCGRYHGGMDCAPDGGRAQWFDRSQTRRARFTADVELYLLRAHLAENAIGKLSEQYQFSPRIVLAGRGIGNLDGRVRYWHYGRDTEVLDDDDDVRIEFDVLDLEALHRFAGRRSQVTLSAGLRLTGIDLTDVEDEEAGGDFIGLTMAADGMTPLGSFRGGHLGLVYGGRLSILGGNWGGDDNSLFVDERVRDDNLLAHELYGGVEVARCFRNIDVHARLVFEVQNWRSDVLAQEAEIESIGFFGPGLVLGAEF